MDERASDERDRFQIGGAESLLVDYDQALDISPALHDAACTRLRVACGSVVASRVKLKEIPKSDSLSSSASTSRVLRLSRRGRSFVSIGTFEPNICTDDILEAGFSKKERDHGCWGYIPDVYGQQGPRDQCPGLGLTLKHLYRQQVRGSRLRRIKKIVESYTVKTSLSG